MLIAAKKRLRRLIESTPLGYRIVLRMYDRVKGPFGMPRAPWHNAVLHSKAERDAACDQVRRLGLPLSGDLAKNWDSLAALDCILRATNRSARILDAGGELYSVILPWLSLYGYHDLYAINLEFVGVEHNRFKRGPITFERGDITSTPFKSEYFDAVTCISVVEHGVDLVRYFREMSRILKPGGVLITSTDYWETPIPTDGKAYFGVPVRIFSRPEIEQAIAIASRFGLVPTGQLDLSCTEKVVRWLELDYTFAVFTMRKLDRSAATGV